MTDPINEAMRIQLTAADLGFDWRELQELWDKLAEEIDELKEAVSQGPDRKRDELGDLFFMVVNLARHLGVNPSQALAQTNDKFNRRFAFIAKNIAQLPPMGDPQRLNAMEALWQEAKMQERTQVPK